MYIVEMNVEYATFISMLQSQLTHIKSARYVLSFRVFSQVACFTIKIYVDVTIEHDLLV